MASIPPSQRRSSASQRSSQGSSSAHSPTTEAPTQIIPGAFDSSETVLLNPSSSSAVEPAVGSPQAARQDPNDVRRCWICFSDETDDTPLQSSSWRKPCPCALTAHEACLLEWVADSEASNTGLPKKLLCPQCKAQIVIARPRSLMVDLVRLVEGAANRLVLPTVLSIGGTTVLYLSVTYGVVAVRMVLGPQDFMRMFSLGVDSPGQNLRKFFGLSIVPWMLVFSRTSLADGILPIIPMLFFVTQPKPDPLLDFSSWPPSAGLSFALLPYARAAYNTYYEQVWGERERRWRDEINPRSSSGEAQQNNNDEVFELEIEVDDDDLRAENQEPQNNGRVEDRPEDHPVNVIPPELPAQGAPALEAEDEEFEDGEGPAPGEHHHHRRLDYSISLVRLAQSVVGALAFPSVAALMGDVLTTVLPRSWTAMPWVARPMRLPSPKPTGLLQTRWGRSIVGGCLIVVLKDAVSLYVRWKMAQNHRKRRVLDHDQKRQARRRP